MEYILLLLGGAFVLRLVYVAGQSKSATRAASSDSTEVYRLCHDRGMSFEDIQRVELQPRVMAWAKARFQELLSSGRSSRTELMAQAVHEAWGRLKQDELCLTLIHWGHIGRAKDGHTFHFRLKDPSTFPIVPDEIVAEIYALTSIWADGANTLPDEIFDLPELEILYMGRAGYPEISGPLPPIPANIATCKTLKILHLQNCEIEEIPDAIFTPWLEELKLGGNRLKYIPDSISRATSLRLLTAWLNELEYVSPAIGELKCLRSIDFTGNRDLRLPESIVNLGKMENIWLDRDIALSDNQKAWLHENKDALLEPIE